MSNDPAVKQSALNDDLLWGAQAIADELGVSIQRVYYLVRERKIPFTKFGPKTIISSKRQLRKALTPAE